MYLYDLVKKFAAETYIKIKEGETIYEGELKYLPITLSHAIVVYAEVKNNKLIVEVVIL